jgi:uncharacterized membrane protein
MNLKNSVIVRQALARPRLLLCGVLGIAVGTLLPQMWVDDAVTRGLIGWNAGAILYLCLAGWMMNTSTDADVQRRALKQDDGRIAILTVVVIASVASLFAIVAELGLAKDLKGSLKIAHIGIAIATIVTSWAFTQVMFALHYAHDYFVNLASDRPAGIDFPGTKDPDYFDFLYCATIIGTSGQTADVSFTDKPMRRIALVQSALAFAFNTTLIALMINIAAGFI